MTDQPKDGGPVFPDPARALSVQDDPFDRPTGMRLRDYFAGQALAAMDLQIAIAEPAASYMAKSAYVVADAMLAERERRK